MAADFKVMNLDLHLAAVVDCMVLIKDTKRLRLSDWENLNPKYFLLSQLFELNLSASLFDSLLQVLSLVLRQTFLQCRRSTVYEILSLFQTKTTSLFNGLNYLQFCTTNLSEYNIERCPLLSCGCSTTCSRTSSNSNSCSSGLNSILVLQDCCQLVYFLNCQIY